jgi:Cu+-exporting ATPase
MRDSHSDPVCGMTVASDGPHHVPHAGVVYHFCSARCLARFREDPARYLGEALAGHAE